MDIDPNSIIPSYFNDLPLLAHLALLLPSQINEPPVDKEALRQILEEDDDLVEILGANFTPRKRRHVKAKEQLDEAFLRRSKCLSGMKAGFKDAKSAQEAKEVAELIPLAMIPASGSSLAPHLNRDVVCGIAEGFLQIHRCVVSVALLDDDVNNDNAM